jgi:nucleoside-diphosphate-sugar epimerase
MDNIYNLSSLYKEKIQGLAGPIVVFGAGGFIGSNLLKSLLSVRDDVFGVSQEICYNWRFISLGISKFNLLSCDITDFTQLNNLLTKLKPQTVFNLAAYGAYSKQKLYKKIHITNFNSGVDMIEILKQNGFNSFVQCGSSSEYGVNSNGPLPSSELIPNSQYAVSKVAMSYAVKYYGKIENLPIVNLRLYSVYGPFEEPDRLIPVAIANALQNKYPPFVNSNISRDFVFITDVVCCLIDAAKQITSIKGLSLNVGTGIKTTMLDLALLLKNIFKLEGQPKFGDMENRDWDTFDWFSNSENTKILLSWYPRVRLIEGLRNIAQWQDEINFNSVYWNPNKK